MGQFGTVSADVKKFRREPRMDPVVRAEWVKELRSGNYEQGKRVLKMVYSDGRVEYCCLGVECERAPEVRQIQPDQVAMRNTGSSDVQFEYVGGPDLHYATRDPNSAYLPEPYRRKIGLTRYREHVLASMNDRKMTFKQIAAYIDRYC